nr:retrovirus-related Pol polyprotein from transposon TNT 1-94 [Tanacetum cinerariifolium]
MIGMLFDPLLLIPMFTGLESLNSRIECDPYFQGLLYDPYFQDLFLIKQLHDIIIKQDRSARQKTVSRSSTEAEYKALANAAAEVLWVQNILRELGVSISQPPTLFCDNTGATYLCANPVYHSRMKHLALDYHFVREKVSDGSIRVLHISSKDQQADALTKPLSRSLFLHFRSKIGVSDSSLILKYSLVNSLL